MMHRFTQANMASSLGRAHVVAFQSHGLLWTLGVVQFPSAPSGLSAALYAITREAVSGFWLVIAELGIQDLRWESLNPLITQEAQMLPCDLEQIAPGWVTPPSSLNHPADIWFDFSVTDARLSDAVDRARGAGVKDKAERRRASTYRAFDANRVWLV